MPLGIQALPLQKSLGGGGIPLHQQSGVGGDVDLGPADTEGAQGLHGFLIPEGDEVHVLFQHPCGPDPVALPGDGADAAAVHHDAAPGPLGLPDGKQIIQQTPGGGGVLNEAAAAADVELAFFHPPSHRR